MSKSTSIHVDLTDLYVLGSDLNGHNIMFRRKPAAIKGCPMGRGTTVNDALLDLKRRVEIESPVILTFNAEVDA